MAIQLPPDAEPQEQALARAGKPQLALELYRKRKAREAAPVPTTIPSEPPAVTRKREEIAKYKREPIPGPTKLPTQRDMVQYHGNLLLQEKKIKQSPTKTYTIDGKKVSKEEALQLIRDANYHLRIYERQIKELEFSLESLRKHGYEASMDEYGKFHLIPPDGMPKEMQTILEIRYAPPGTKFHDASGREISKSQALSMAWQDYDDMIYGLARAKRVASNPLMAIFETIGMFFVKEETRAPLLAEFKEKVEMKISPTAQNIREAAEAQERRFRAEGKLLAEFARVEKIGTWQAYAGYFKEAIELGATVVASYGLGAVVGGISGARAAKVAGTTTVSGFKITTAIKTAVMVGIGVAAVAPSVIQNLQIIDEQNKKLKKLNDDYNLKIQRAGEEERKRLEREKEYEKEAIEESIDRAYGSLIQIGLQILLAAKYGRRGYKAGYARGFQYKYGKMHFVPGTPKAKMYKYGMRALRKMKTVPTKFYKPLKATARTPKAKTAEVVRFAKKYKATLTGSGASYQQIKGFRTKYYRRPGFKVVKDIDLYMEKESQVKWAKRLLHAKQHGIDIHGPTFRKPGGYYEMGEWVPAKPKYIKGVKVVGPGEQTMRKGIQTMRYYAGKAPERSKDVLDFAEHMESQIQSAKASLNPITKTKGYLAGRDWIKYRQAYAQEFGKWPELAKKVKVTTPAKVTVPKAVKVVKPKPSYYKPTKPTIPKTTFVKPYTKVTKPKILPIFVAKPPKRKPPTYRPTITPPTKKPPVILTTTPVYTPTITTTFPTQKKKKPKPKPIPKFPEGPAKKREIAIAYNVYIKKMGTWVKLNTYPLKLSSALGLGAERVDKTTSIYFKIEKISRPPTTDSTHDNTWNKLKYKFIKTSANTYKEKEAYQEDYEIKAQKYRTTPFKPKKFKLKGLKIKRKRRKKKINIRR